MPPPKYHSEKRFHLKKKTSKSLGFIARTRFYYMELSQGQIIQNPNKQELSSLFMTHRLNVMHAPVKFHKYIPYGLGVMAGIRFYYMELSQGQIKPKPNMRELSSLFMKHRLNVLHAPVKFHKYIP